MKWKFGIFFSLLLISFLIIRNVFASGVVINEVMFDPGENDTGQEWIELYNSSESAVDLSGWQVYPDGIGYFTIPSDFLLGSKKFVVIHLRLDGDNSAPDLYHTTTSSSNMSDTAGSIALFSREPRGKDTMKSFMQWGRGGETWESDADKAGIWIKSTFVDIASFAKGSTLVLNKDGINIDGKSAWSISQKPSQGASNTVITMTLSGTSSSSVTSASPVAPALSSAPSSAPQSIVAIKAYAGEDRSAMAGTHFEFLGHALGIHDEPIDASARFFWNFGDGETQEGRSVAHVYRMPGSYMAGVHISSGEYTASDYIRVTIIPNLVSISDVVLGIDGYVRMTNASDIDADISGWIMRDGKGHFFAIPPRTLVGRHAVIALPNAITGLLKESQTLPLTILYPNGTDAFIYNGTSTFFAVETRMAEIHKEPIPSPSLVVQKEEQKKDTVTLAASKSPHAPDPIPDSADMLKESAVVSGNAPFVSTPLLLALGVSLLGAIGFFILKQGLL